MITVKVAQVVTALVAIACLAFGYGTAWFIVGMFVGIASLILDGLHRALSKPPVRVQLTTGETAEVKCASVTVEITHTKPVARSVIEGGRRPIWPSEIGAPE